MPTEVEMWIKDTATGQNRQAEDSDFAGSGGGGGTVTQGAAGSEDWLVDTGVVTVVGFNSGVEVSITTSGAYSAGDNVGGKVTLPSALRTNDASAVQPGILHSVVLKDYGAGTANLMVGFFKSDPSQGTYTDNAAFPSLATNTNDADKLVAVREIASSDWKSFGSISVATIGGLGIPVPAGASTSYYMLIQAVATPSFTNGTLKAVVGFLPD